MISLQAHAIWQHAGEFIKLANATRDKRFCALLARYCEQIEATLHSDETDAIKAGNVRAFSLAFKQMASYRDGQHDLLLDKLLRCAEALIVTLSHTAEPSDAH